MSCCRSIKSCQVKAAYTFFPYQCNYDLLFARLKPFNNSITFSALNIPHEIIQQDATIIQWLTHLPDINVYHHFATSALSEFDYVLFCHDDIFFRNQPVFDHLIQILSSAQYNLIADTSMTCNKDLSVRFYPFFIFVSSKKFKEAKLSFYNELNMYNNKDFNIYPPRYDGGAALLASYYSKDNTVDAHPYTGFKERWCKHFRFQSDYGVEFYDLLFPNTPEFLDLKTKAARYVEYAKNSI